MLRDGMIDGATDRHSRQRDERCGCRTPRFAPLCTVDGYRLHNIIPFAGGLPVA
jgi:hypothetical protein